MRKVSSYSALLFCIATIAGCSSTPSSERADKVLAPQHDQLKAPLSPHDIKMKHSFLDVYKRWEGVPYRYGGTSLNGVDCSAFVQVAIKDVLNVALPRTTLQQVKIGHELPYSKAQVGDLAFFKTSRNVRHVGVYVGHKQFMHASTSKGVIISRLDNPYWASKFWHFRRVVNSSETL
ncbi:putative lipoprotein NlpC [Vibrio sinaloensis DSM 21326]|uniref:Putative lipoprotein NlpC n=1 Tax=Vibrio sinaloensis DSM 21326 TaxID=945550 RepID=E8MAM1_PHOS4|nr:NlpC/P60 family protein [Vibrio sinaloensis]EGA68942.1 putative lipoprotein NlpC [Vibrio sinaloensis DSM 21326]